METDDGRTPPHSAPRGMGTRPYPWPQKWAENHFFRFSNAPTNPRNRASSIHLVSQISKILVSNTEK